MVDQDAINMALQYVLSHGADISFGRVPEDMRLRLNALTAAGDDSVPSITSAIVSCPALSGTLYWWKGARELCEVLLSIRTTASMKALLEILETDSNVVEFDDIRGTAARCLGGFGDPAIVPELQAAMEAPNAPILSIRKTIETLGGETHVEQHGCLSCGHLNKATNRFCIKCGSSLGPPEVEA